jgi:hypothetical protein
MRIEEFADSDRHPFYTFEGRMAAAFRKAVEDLELALDSLDLYRIDEAQKRVAEIQTDVENFMNIVGGYSRHDVAERLNRSKLDIEKAKRKARNILKKATLGNPDLSPNNVEKLDVVQTAYKERDRIIAGLKPIIAESKKKLNRAEKILEKY